MATYDLLMQELCQLEMKTRKERIQRALRISVIGCNNTYKAMLAKQRIEKLLQQKIKLLEELDDALLQFEIEVGLE